MKRWGLFAFVIVTGMSLGQVAEIPWRLPRGDATNRGFVALPLSPPLAVFWSFVPPQPARVNRFPIVHDGQRAFLVTPNSLYALSLVDGQLNENWKTTNLPYVLTTAPVLADGRVYVGTSRGEVLAFDAETGAPAGTISLQQTTISALGTYDGYLFIGTSDGFVHCAPLGNLMESHSVRLGAPVTTNFAFIAQKEMTIVCVGTASRLFFLSLTMQGGRLTLRELSRPLPPAGGLLTDPVYDPTWTHTVYIGAGEFLARYNRFGQPMMPLRLKGSVRGAPVVAPDGTVFVGTDAGNVYALAPRSLAVRWQKTLPSGVHAPMLGTGDTVWAATFDGLLMGLDAETGEVKWRFRLGDINPNFVSVTTYAPIAAAPFGLVVVDTLGRAYAFTTAQFIQDAAPPAFYEPTLLLLSAERQIANYRLFDDALTPETPTIPGRPPIYLRVRVADRETGVNERSLKAQLLALRSRPPQVTDLTGTFKPALGEWTIDVHVDKTSSETPGRVVRVLPPLPDGEYLVVLHARDYAGNTARQAFAFRVDNTLPPPRLSTAQMTPGAPGTPGAPSTPRPGVPGGVGGSPGLGGY